ncbi:MAG: translation elongation factor Ts, partial [Bacteroidota bacterium]
MDTQNILKLKKLTQARTLDCKNALEQSNGDLEKAIIWLRKQGQKIAAKKLDKITNQGTIFAKVNADNQFGVIFTLSCETDFVARNHLFQELSSNLLHIALENQCIDLKMFLKTEKDGVSVQKIIEEGVARLGENILITKYATLSGSLVSAYIHTGNRIGSLVSLSGQHDKGLQVAQEMAIQVVFSDPIAIDEDSIDASIVEREKLIIEENLAKEGKPAAIAEKIMQGKLSKFFQENTLLAQPFFKDDSKTVRQYL